MISNCHPQRPYWKFGLTVSLTESWCVTAVLVKSHTLELQQNCSVTVILSNSLWFHCSNICKKMVSHYYSQWSWILTIDQDWIVGSLSSQFVKITVWVIQFLSNDLYVLTAVMTRNSEGSKLETTFQDKLRYHRLFFLS
jgi:hypothetical protein